MNVVMLLAICDGELLFDIFSCHYCAFTAIYICLILPEPSLVRKNLRKPLYGIFEVTTGAGAGTTGAEEGTTGAGTDGVHVTL